MRTVLPAGKLSLAAVRCLSQRISLVGHPHLWCRPSRETCGRLPVVAGQRSAAAPAPNRLNCYGMDGRPHATSRSSNCSPQIQNDGGQPVPAGHTTMAGPASWPAGPLQELAAAGLACVVARPLGTVVVVHIVLLRVAIGRGRKWSLTVMLLLWLLNSMLQWPSAALVKFSANATPHRAQPVARPRLTPPPPSLVTWPCAY